MIYASEGWQSDDRAIYNTLERAKTPGAMLLVHAESARVLDELIARHHNPDEMKKLGADGDKHTMQSGFTTLERIGEEPAAAPAPATPADPVEPDDDDPEAEAVLGEAKAILAATEPAHVG